MMSYLGRPAVQRTLQRGHRLTGGRGVCRGEGTWGKVCTREVGGGGGGSSCY